MKQWVLRDKSGFGNLLLEESPLPEIGDFDVLIKVHAVSLNYRDLMIAQVVLLAPISCFALINTSGNILLATQTHHSPRVRPPSYSA